MKEFLKSTLQNGVSTFLGNALGSFGQGVANSIFGETLEDKQRYALEQMEQQAKLNRENFDYQFGRQLQATDPSFIRQRLERAGLSASLAFQNGASSPGISAQMGSSSTPGGISSSLRSGQMVNMAESMARIRNLDADTEGKKTETDYNQKAMQTRLDILSEEKLSKMYSNTIARIDALYKEELTSVTLDKLKKEMDAITFDMANRKDLTDIERQKLNGYLESLTHQYSLWQSEIGLNVAKTQTEGTQQDLNVANTREQTARSAQLEFDNKMQQTIGYRPGWSIWQLLAGIYQKAVFVTGYQDDIDNVPEDVEKSVKTWFDKLKPEEQKLIKENLKNFIWQLK